MVPLQLRPDVARARINAIARDTSKVILSKHALQRMDEREISDVEVYRLLQSGDVLEMPTRTRNKEWKCKIVKRIKGNRDAGAVTIILNDGMLFVITVEWEDIGS